MSTATSASVAKTASSLTATASATDKDRKTIAQNFDAFLSLLTTQLKNQSPLDPLDANQFTQQLVQFSSVEQQLKTNDLLSAMSKSLGTRGSGGAGGRMNAASAASLLGTTVTADASTSGVTSVGGGRYEAKWPVTVQSNYTNYQVSITDSAGKEVYRAPWTPPGTGEQTFSWTGTVTNPDAKFDPTASYTIRVQGDLAGSNGATKSVMKTETRGVVKSIDLSGTEEMIQFGDYTVPISKIKRVGQANS
jgi:flagellar basal-body rod modification protein FlgD